MNLNTLLSSIETKSNTEWILKSVVQNPCAIIVFGNNSLAEMAKSDYIEMTKSVIRQSSDDFPKFISLEKLNHYSIDMNRPVIFDNSCFY